MKALKWLALIPVVALLLYGAWIAMDLYHLPSVARLADPETNLVIEVKDWHGKAHPFIVGPDNPWWTPLEKISPRMKWAVIVAEDGNFYEHEGIDVKAMKEAFKYDLEKRRFARGASTITQQTAKNLFLSPKKTVTRKIEEIYLAKRMEQKLTKGRILELYLNIVELGPMVYGVGRAAHYYFDKPPKALSAREAAFLAAMLPGPQKIYNPYRHLDRVLKRSDMVLKLMRVNHAISDPEYRKALAEKPDLVGMQKKVDDSLAGKVRAFFKSLFDSLR